MNQTFRFSIGNARFQYSDSKGSQAVDFPVFCRCSNGNYLKSLLDRRAIDMSRVIAGRENHVILLTKNEAHVLMAQVLEDTMNDRLPGVDAEGYTQSDRIVQSSLPVVGIGQA